MDEPAEAEDVLPARKILVITLVVVSATIALCVVAWLLLLAREGALRPSGRFPEEALGPPQGSAGLFARPDARPGLPAEQRERLDGYGWVDREHGVVRIPIERAIDLVVGGKR
jgi:hypothetical protein